MTNATKNVSADAWRKAAADNFLAIIARLLDVSRSDIRLTLHEHPDTAAVDWTAHNDGSWTIALFFPRMRPGQKLTRADADAMTGYWIHEMIHPKYTNKTAWRKAVAKGPGFSGMVNALEDVRGEKLLIADAGDYLAGARRCLTVITERKVWPFPADAKHANDPQLIAVLLAYVGRAKLNGYDLAKADALLAALTPENRQLVDAVLKALAKAKSTMAVNAIVEKFFPAPQQPQQEPGQGEAGEAGEQQQGDQQDAGQSGDGEAADDQQDDQQDADGQSGDDQTADQGTADDQQDAGNKTVDQQQDDQQDGLSGADADNGAGSDAKSFVDIDLESDEIKSADLHDMAKEIADKVNVQPMGKTAKDLLDRADQTAVTDYPDQHFRGGPNDFSMADYQSLRRSVDGIGKVRAAVRRLVRSADSVAWSRRLESGRFDVRAAGRVRIGQRDVFAKRTETAGHKAAVTILLDTSSSMRRHAHGQTAMAINIAEAVEASGCQISVCGFGVDPRTGHDSLAVVKGFHEKCKKVFKRFVASAAVLYPSTPLSENVLKASEHLAKADATEHVLIVLTDGSCNSGDLAVLNAVAFAKQRGQKVIGVAIKRERCLQAMANADALVFSPDGASLSGKVLDALVTQLEKGR